MEEVSSLARKLKHHLPLHQARITFIAQFILALIRSRSTNLYRVAEEFQTTADSESSYRRIKRFFADYEYSYEQLGQLILACLEIDRFTLCMDRTNWKHGSQDVNYLVISIAWQGNSIPIVWECLDKNGGNSNTQERIAVMKRVLKLIPADQIDSLLADREFIGHDWFEWLDQHNLRCRLRVKESFPVEHNGTNIAIGQLCRGVMLNQTVTWYTKKKVSGVPLYISAHRSLKGLLIVVATSKPETMITDYSRRWGIETLFGCLKSRGFDLESTHMTQHDRMDKLLGLLTLAFTWCLIVGHWKHGDATFLPLNKHYRPAKSLFRLGLDILRRVLKNRCASGDAVTFEGLLNILSRT
ncbi:IS4 family transposase [Endozoicomonas atrinae]|uniref:IS4 family transposase n=1 Tax=Endozoicomonas atrinae TaxID=1333660 RepID=UPI003B003EF2